MLIAPMKVSRIIILLLVLSGFVVNFNAQERTVEVVKAEDYPFSTEELALGISGEMKLGLEVNEKGNVTRAYVYVGPSWPCGADIDSKLNKLMRAIEKWSESYTFVPASTNGKAKATRIGLTIKIPSKPVEGVLDKKAKLVTGGVINGKAVKLEKPAYPAAARAERASGTVRVQVLISEEGEVMSAQALDGHPLLMFASRYAACRSKFSPTTLDGDPVKVSGVIIYNFVP